MTGRTALVFGLSEAASAIAHRLHRDRWRVVLALDAPPKAHRRHMSFADFWWDGSVALNGSLQIAASVTVRFSGGSSGLPWREPADLG